MKKVNSEIQKIINKTKDAQAKIQVILKDQSWMVEAKKFAESQKKEVHKLLASDVTKVKTFLERERKELEKFQAQIPGEVKKLKSLIQKQRTEFEKLIHNLKQAAQAKPTPTKKKATAKKRATKKAVTSAPAQN